MGRRTGRGQELAAQWPQAEGRPASGREMESGGRSGLQIERPKGDDWQQSCQAAAQPSKSGNTGINENAAKKGME